MSLRLLADENVDQRVVHRLTHFGHDVEHVGFVAELGKGSDDGAIARYSLSDDRFILTSDDEHCGGLFVEDETLTVVMIADIVHAIGGFVDPEWVSGVLYVRSSWL